MKAIQAKAERIMRRHRLGVFANDDAEAERHARAIRRLVKTKTWRAIVADSRDRQSIALGERLAQMGY